MGARKWTIQLTVGLLCLVLWAPMGARCQQGPMAPSPDGDDGRPSRTSTSPRRTPPSPRPSHASVRPNTPFSSGPTPPRPTGCTRDDDCADGLDCTLGRCVPERPIPTPAPTPRPGNCRGKSVLDILKARNQSQSFLESLTSAFDKELFALLNRSDAQLTVFVPTKKAFQRAYNGSVETLIQSNTECLKATLRLHVAVRTFNTSQLVSAGTIATLQGWQLKVNAVASSATPNLQVVTAARASTMPVSINRVDHNIEACNGVIHFVDRLLTPPFMLPDTQQKSLADAIKAYPSLSEFSRALTESTISDALQGSKHYTIFAPTNNAFRLANTSIFLLKQDASLSKLVGLVRSHIAAMTYSIVDLERMAPIKTPINSLDGQLVNGSVMISPSASLRIQNASLIQTNISTANGIIHIVDGLFDAHIPPNRCIKHTKDIFPGTCTSCLGGRPVMSLSCRHGFPVRKDSIGKDCSSPRQCRYLECERERTELGCCDGYYGAECRPCPGANVAAPCSGHGTCHDGRNGSGKCSCGSGYDGAACESPLSQNPPQSSGPFSNHPSTHTSSSSSESSDDGDMGRIPPSSETGASSSTRSQYFLIPLSVGVTLAVLVIIAAIVLWRMRVRSVNIANRDIPAASPAPGRGQTGGLPPDIQIVPGRLNTYVCRRTGTAFVVVSPQQQTTGFNSESGNTMLSIKEEDEVVAEEEDTSSPKDDTKSLSTLSMSELVRNQYPVGHDKEASPTHSLEATSSNELLER